MTVRDPKKLSEHFNTLFRAGDLEGLLKLYEAEAVLCPAPGVELRGQQQIRGQLKALLAMQGDLTATQLSCVQQDGLAMLHAKWSFKGIDSAGNVLELGGFSSKLARRSPDGGWRYLLDLPLAFA